MVAQCNLRKADNNFLSNLIKAKGSVKPIIYRVMPSTKRLDLTNKFDKNLDETRSVKCNKMVLI